MSDTNQNRVRSGSEFSRDKQAGFGNNQQRPQSGGNKPVQSSGARNPQGNGAQHNTGMSRYYMRLESLKLAVASLDGIDVPDTQAHATKILGIARTFETHLAEVLPK